MNKKTFAVAAGILMILNFSLGDVLPGTQDARGFSSIPGVI